MSASWLPTKDIELLKFGTDAAAIISGNPTALGLTASDATTFTTLLNNFQTAYDAATNPNTRTPVTVGAKDVAKAAFVADFRSLAKRIQANPAVTVEQKLSIGLPIHKTTPTPIPAPSTKPELNVVSNGGRTVRIRINDETTPNKKAKPPGYEGSAIYTYVPTNGEPPPASFEDWRFEGLATRSSFDINYRPGDVTKTAYIAANWLNPKGDAGPACTPISVQIAA
jgi:hypothetical protein